MSTTLYKEAIAEAQQLKQLAEQNAKNKIIEALTPRIQAMVESQLSSEDSEIEIEFVAGKGGNGRDRVIIFQVNYGLGHGGGDRGRGHGADRGDVELDNASGPVEQQAVLPSPAAVLEEGATIVAQAQPGDAAEAAADAVPRDPEVDSLHNVFQRLSVTEQKAVPPTPL